MIYEERVIAGLRCIADGCIGACERKNKCAQAVAIDALELLKRQRWISVKERLPDKSCKVLVYCKGNYITDVTYSKKHEQFNNFDECEKSKNDFGVIYWMPLPEPPKEG